MRIEKRFLAFAVITTMMFSFVACGAKEETAATENKPEVTTEETVVDDVSETEDITTEATDAAADVTLPAYEYPGPEYFYSVLYKYIVDEYGKDYPETDVKIPCITIIEEDDSDKEDIKVYGSFWIFGYDLNGDILENKNGGAYPGCIHIKFADGDYQVTGMDVVEDGNKYEESAKEIFGKYYDKFTEIESDSDAREAVRAQIISNYVFANNLSITAYQDYGWDPVTLPEENIDSFYSILD